MHTARRVPRWLVLSIVLVACGETVSSDPDGSRFDAQTAADAATQCASDADCADPIYCNGAEYCDPSSAESDARGCVPGRPACAAGEICDEATDSCVIDCPVAPDGDGDGHLAIECGGDDCDDHDAERFPGNVEICDSTGHDEDCNPATFGFLDADGDGAGSGVCCNVQADGSLLCGGDCNDADGSVHPAAGDGPPLYCDGVDNDCDGERDEGCPCTEGEEEACGTDVQLMRIGICRPGRRYCVGGAFTMCSGAIDPAAEICDTLDNDCDGTVDEAVQRTYYRDADGDGFGVPGTSTLACSPPPGWSSDDRDCDDAVASTNPAAAELCNGVDDDCDGTADEGVTTRFYRDMDGDGFGDVSMPIEACSRPTGYVTDSTDCDDTRGPVNPAAVETCDGIDNNCDADTDAGCTCTDGATMPCGSSSIGECTLGTQRCVSGAWGECVGAVAPRAETCNELDDDCDGTIDDGVTSTFYRDADGDGFGDPGATTTACAPPAGYVRSSTDCDDTRAGVNPAQIERCNGIDDNCSAGTDEGCECTDGSTEACGTSDGAGGVLTTGECVAGLRQCVAGTWGGCVGSVGPQPESCNGRDDDCDGTTDEGVTSTYYRDADGDGFGTLSTTAMACAPPGGYVATSTDCDDASAAVNPAQAERCNGFDDNCVDGADEGCSCIDGTSQTCGPSDGMGGFETRGACATGLQQCVAGTWGTCVGSIAPEPERCNGADDDCDGTVDETTTASCYTDGDGDGFGAGALRIVCATGTGDCPAGFSTGGGDCNDGVASIHPSAAEVCNGVDDDCSGAADDGSGMVCVSGTSRSGTGGYGTCASGVPGTYVCDACTSETFVAAPSAESCNGLDDDCDGVADDAFACVRGSTGNACTTACGTIGTYTCSSSCTPGACRTADEGPAVPGTCNGCDDDLDGRVDDVGEAGGFTCAFGSTRTCSTACKPGLSTGTQRCLSDCSGWDTCREIESTVASDCNACDDDVDGAIDEGFLCVRGSVEGCITGCGTAGTRTCNSTCSGYSACAAAIETCNYCDDDGDLTWDDDEPYAVRERRYGFECADVTPYGNATCVGAITGGTNQSGAVYHSQRVRLGFGDLVFVGDVTALTSNAAPDNPGLGWALVIFRATPGTSFLGTTANLGVTHTRDGYAAEWLFRGSLGDQAQLRQLLYSSTSDTVIRGPVLTGPDLDGPHLQTARQRLTIELRPDIPGTSTNEMRLCATWGTGGSAIGTCCTGTGCPVQLRVNEEVYIGITGGTSSTSAASVVLASGTEAVQSRVCY